MHRHVLVDLPKTVRKATYIGMDLDTYFKSAGFVIHTVQCRRREDSYGGFHCQKLVVLQQA